MSSLASDKPLVMMFPFDLMAHYLRCLQLAKSVRSLCEVAFVDSAKYGKEVRAAGFRTFACEQFDADVVMACARRFDFSWLNVDDLRRVLNSQVETIKRHKPAMVLSDTAPTLRMAAEMTGTRHLALMNGYMTKYYSRTRRISQAHPAAQFQQRMPPRLFDWMTRCGEAIAFRRVHRPFKRLRSEYHLPPRRRYLDELEGDLNLICDVEILFPQRSLPAHYHFIGPLFHEGAHDESEIRSLLRADRPTLLVSTGSSGEAEKFAFLTESRFARYNVIASGEQSLQLAASHVFAKPFVDYSAILDRVDLVICHGGNGTIYHALAFGIPVLCAASNFEQEWNVQAITELGLGADLGIVSDTEQKAELIEAWLQRKNQGMLSAIREQIALSRSNDSFADYCRSLLRRGWI